MSELKTNLEQILQEKETKIIPENIKKDIQIFDVIGTYESGGGIDTSSDNPITVEDVAEGKEGFVNGEKVIGNAHTINSGDSAIAINSPYTYQTGPVGQLQICGQAPVWSNGQTSTLFKQGSQTFISILKEEQPDLANAISLTPEKLVKGNTVLGIEGIAEASVGAKLFETQEKMQADSSAKEGDLAVVYREEIQNMTSDTQTQYITFPETVTLPTAQGGATRGDLISTDGGSFIGQATYSLTSSTFSFNMYASSGIIQVQYESTDGITYTRTLFDTLENPVDLGTMMTPDGTLPDNCGYFMQVGGNIFEGLFECNNIPNPDTVRAYKFYKYIEEDGERVPDKEDTEFTKEEVTLFKESMENSNFDSFAAVLIKNLDTEEYYVASPNAAVLLTSEKAYICGIPPRNDEESVDFNSSLYKVNTITKTLEQLDTVSSITAIQGDDCWFGCPLPNMNKIQISKVGYPSFEESYVRYYANNNQWVNIDLPPRTNILKYEFVSSQLTTTVDKVYNSTYYGKDGVNEGTLTSAPAHTLDDTNAEVYYKLMQFYDNMEPIKVQNGQTFKNAYFITNSYGDVLLDLSEVTNASNMFNGNKYIVECPELNTSNVTNTTFMFNDCTNLISAPEMDTSKVTAMNFMFAYDTNLGVVPVYDTSNVTTMNDMFYMCPNLSDEALNNIMQMCINTTDKYTENKTLRALDISSALATRCITLSNYEAFTAAGWTTGY